MKSAVFGRTVSYEPVASKVRPSSTGPIAPASAAMLKAIPYSVENARRPKYREIRYGVTSSSPPSPRPRNAAAVTPEMNELADASSQVPSAAIDNSPKDTRGPGNRSRHQPAVKRPIKLAAPIAEMTHAASA